MGGILHPPWTLIDKMRPSDAVRPLQLEERDLLDPKKAVDKNGTVTFLFVPKIHGGPGLLISFEVGGSFNLRLNKDWRFKLTPSLNVGDLFIHFKEFRKLTGFGLPGQPSIKLGFEGGSEDDPLYRFGKEDGSHLEFGQFEIEFEWSTAVAGVRAVSRKSELVLNLGKSGDGFLSQILPGEKRIPLNLGLGWSTERGFFIDGGKGNVITQTNPPPRHRFPDCGAGCVGAVDGGGSQRRGRRQRRGSQSRHASGQDVRSGACAVSFARAHAEVGQRPGQTDAQRRHRGGHHTGTSHRHFRQSRILADCRFRQTGWQPEPLRPDFGFRRRQRSDWTSMQGGARRGFPTSTASTRSTPPCI